MQSVLKWLLDSGQPAIRYRTLTEILDRPFQDEDVQRAYSEISKKGWAAKILREQLPGFGGRFHGYWHNYVLLNRPKYVTTVWKFLVLIDLGLTAKNSKILKTCKLLSARYLKHKESFHLCKTSNLARTFILAGYD